MGMLDLEYPYNMSVEEVICLLQRSIYHATHLDAGSVDVKNFKHVTKKICVNISSENIIVVQCMYWVKRKT